VTVEADGTGRRELEHLGSEAVANLAELFSMRIDGTHLRRLTPYRWDVAAKHEWSPGGTRIALTRNANLAAGHSANIVTIRADGHDVRP
jgi:hypothetical protein